MSRAGWARISASAALSYGALLHALASLCACTHDFSSFRFVEAEPVRPSEASAQDSSKPGTPDSDATLIMPLGAPADAAPPLSNDKPADAGVHDASTSDPRDANSVPPQPPAADASTTADATSHQDDDAQVANDAGQCLQQWSAASQPAGACGTCACAQCEEPVANCLSHGTVQERALCSAVLACALANKCHDWDCYCTPARCAMPSLPGDGPCSEQIAAAAGGHDFVSAVHRANDPNQPLVKAVHAIGCSVGVPWGSVGGAVTGKCISQCTP